MIGEALLRRRTWTSSKRKTAKGATRPALLVPLVTVGSVLVMGILIRLVLDPFASHETRKALDQMDGFQGDFQAVHVSVFGPGYDITRLKITTESKGSTETANKPPIFYAEHVHVGISWRDLLHGKLVAAIRLDKPKVSIVQPQTQPKPADKPATKALDLSAQLQKIVGLKVDRIEVFAGEVVFREGGGPHPQELWVHRLELAAQNLSTRRSLAKGRPAMVSGHGVLGRSGDLNLFVSADPFASPLNFAGQMSVTGLRASELYAFIEPKAHVKAERGTVDVFAEFVSKDGLLTGGIKPVLKNIEIGPTEAGLWNRMKAWLADKTVEITSDRIPERNAVATTIPFKGKLTDPDIQLWPTVLGIIRNAFVRGLAGGFANVPPQTAETKEGALTQAKNALKKDEGPPKAQPVTR